MRLNRRIAVFLVALLSVATVSAASAATKSADSSRPETERASSPDTSAHDFNFNAIKELKGIEPPEPEPRFVAVQRGDYLEKIAEAHGLTTQRLFDANPDVADPSVVFVGQQLRIPEPGEQLAHREMPKPVVVEITQINTKRGPPRQVTQAASISADVETLMLALADCETGDHDAVEPFTANWTLDSRYDGGMQFDPPTWNKYRTGYDFAYQAPPALQRSIAWQNIQKSGWDSQHPDCTKMMRRAGYNI